MKVIFSILILIINTLQISIAAAEAEITKTITVQIKGHGDFESVQEAIDSVPAQNNKWIKIKIKAGVYMEKVIIPEGKGYLMLEGEGANITVISWSDHDANVSLYNHFPNHYKMRWDHYSKRNELTQYNDSATLAVWAENVVIKNLGVKNNYGRGLYEGKAVAVTLAADKIAVYDCNFVGIQDTLCDLYHRHYFRNCYIEGAVDFIWGFGQSLYENCTIHTVPSKPNFVGWVTANGRYQEDSSGFVFKDCIVTGREKTYLGRAWRPFAKVIFYETYMDSIVVPRGWDNNNLDGYLTTFVERNNSGPGANMDGRVNWMKHLNVSQLNPLVARSFVDDGWISQQPMSIS